MSRPLRIDVENGWYHVISRGLNRQAIYADEGDRRHFLELLEEFSARYRIGIHACVLMDNRFHLIVQTPEANLSAAMQWLKTSYSAWFNARHARSGPVFGGRFKSILVENAAWAGRLSIYVHLNPVRIGSLSLGKKDRALGRLGKKAVPDDVVKARLETLRTYTWSSYRVYAGYEKGPEWLIVKDLLKRMGGSTIKYRKEVQKLAGEGKYPDQFENFANSIMVGTDEFVRRMKKKAAETMRRETSGKRMSRSRVGMAEIIRGVETVCGMPWSEISMQRGHQGKALAMWAARTYGGMTLKQIGMEMGGVDYAAVIMRIRRYEKLLKTDREARKTMNELVKKLNVNAALSK